MKIEDFELPTKEKIRLVFGENHEGFGARYLNAVRVKEVAEDDALAQQYNGMIKVRSVQLMDLVKEALPAYDAVVSPPSSRSDAVPIRNAALWGTAARDLTARFGRHGDVKAQTPGVTFHDMVGEFTYERAGDEDQIKSLLIVDDSIESGKSIASLLEHMRNAGLTDQCELSVVVWVNMSQATEEDAPKTGADALSTRG